MAPNDDDDNDCETMLGKGAAASTDTSAGGSTYINTGGGSASAGAGAGAGARPRSDSVYDGFGASGSDATVGGNDYEQYDQYERMEGNVGAEATSSSGGGSGGGDDARPYNEVATGGAKTYGAKKATVDQDTNQGGDLDVRMTGRLPLGETPPQSWARVRRKTLAWPHLHPPLFRKAVLTTPAPPILLCVPPLSTLVAQVFIESESQAPKKKGRRCK